MAFFKIVFLVKAHMRTWSSEPELPEPVHFAWSRSRSRSRRTVLLGAGAGAGAGMLPRSRSRSRSRSRPKMSRLRIPAVETFRECFGSASQGSYECLLWPLVRKVVRKIEDWVLVRLLSPSPGIGTKMRYAMLGEWTLLICSDLKCLTSLHMRHLYGRDTDNCWWLSMGEEQKNGGLSDVTK